MPVATHPDDQSNIIDEKIALMHAHQDAVERFLAVYDLYRMLRYSRLSVADATRIMSALEQAAGDDRDLNVRSWAKYARQRAMGKIGEHPRPFLPRQWALLIVDDWI